MSIEAMKQALEALESYQCFIDNAHIIEGQWHWLDGTRESITALRQAIEQAEKQEPDAWLSGEGLELKQVFVKQNGDWTELPFSIGRPRKEWVGLTDTEVINIYGGEWLNDMDFARAIEAKLKEKNT